MRSLEATDGIERRKVMDDLDQYARLCLRQREIEGSLVLYCYKSLTRELGIKEDRMLTVLNKYKKSETLQQRKKAIVD